MGLKELFETLRLINKLYAKSLPSVSKHAARTPRDEELNRIKADKQVAQLLASHQDDEAKRYLQQIIQDMQKKQGVLAQNTPAIIEYADPNSSSHYGEYYISQHYQFLMPYCQLAYLSEKNGIPEEHALKLSILFDDPKEALNYIRKNIKQNKLAIHDACLFALPTDLNFSKWKKLIKKTSMKRAFVNC